MRKALYLLIACMAVAACSQRTKEALPATGNAVYYWRTTFSLDSAEQDFLKVHHIGRIYCRYFDVVDDAQRGLTPNATLAFSAAMPPSCDIVPTVFIMENCLRKMQADSLAQRIVKRIVQMNETNDVVGVREIQIDCDYTARSRQAYYRLLALIRAEARRHGMALSTTIRLHQLSMPAPPADYGVLMLYNTGAPDRFTERNPILDRRDVLPYLKHLKAYHLPLAAAYPVFLWRRTVHGVQLQHEADFSEIMAVKEAVEAERSDVRSLILTYHLAEENINRYEPDQYEAIFHH